MIFKSIFPDIEIPKTGVYQYVTSNPYEINDEKVIFIDGTTDKRLTYGKFKSNTKKLANGLVNKVGFKRGDVLAIFSPNHLDYPIVIFGAIVAGGKVTTVNPTYTAEELTHHLKDCGVSVIVAHPSFLINAIKAAAATNIPESKIFLFDDKEINGIQPFSSFFISEKEFNPIEYTPEEAKSTTAYLCYSSGTTGKSKGVEITHTNMVSNLAQLHTFEDKVNHETSFFAAVPFYHMYGLSHLIHFVVLKGILCVILPKYDLETLCRVIQDYKVNLAPLVPPIVLSLVKDPIAKRYDLSSLRLAWSGAAPLSKELCNNFVKIYKVPIKQSYGLTETSPITHFTRTENIVNGSIGVLLPNVECKIVSADGRELGYNEPGEFHIRGPNVMKGYLNNKKATEACIDSDGWFRTGDVGLVDSQGNFYIVDRVKELIKYKGYQVAPAELESVLITHPLIADAAVIGRYSIEDETEYPVAYVVLQPNTIQSDQLKEEIKNYVSQRVAQHKRLRGGINFIDRIPKSPSGKIFRKLLRERAKL